MQPKTQFPEFEEVTLERMVWRAQHAVSENTLRHVPDPNRLLRQVQENLEQQIRTHVVEAHLLCRELGRAEWPASAWEAFKDRLYRCRFTGWLSRRWPVKRKGVKLLEWWPDIKLPDGQRRCALAFCKNELEAAEYI